MNAQNAVQQQAVTVQTATAALDGDLAIPLAAKGIVLFAHGSGSSRFSGRNRYVAGALNQAGLATLLFDLLTPDEHDQDLQTRQLRFDIDLLTQRLTSAVDWVIGRPETERLKIGLFGASTGAAAALGAAAARPDNVAAVVSRGGRPDLAAGALPRVTAPTLLIVGGNDVAVLDLNTEASRALQCEKDLAVVEGATHLFEEPGKLEEVARLAAAWFARHLA